LSRSPDKNHLYSQNHPLPPLSSSFHKENIDIPTNVTMEIASTQSESEQMLQAQVEILRRKCEKLTTERFIMKGQLKEARGKVERSSMSNVSSGSGSVIDKFQLQQTMRCGYCLKTFESDRSGSIAPIASQACGHSICRSCCQQRLSSSQRAHRRRNENIYSSERLRSTISSDLFMCMGDINQVYCSSDEEDGESCPICRAPKAFRHGRLHVNESLCVVLKLLDR